MSDFEDDAGDWSDCVGNDYDDDVQDKLDLNEDNLSDDGIEDNYGATDGAEALEQCKKTRKVLSLKENCLQTITKNFERFNTAFLTTEDALLRRNLTFLQMVYSSHVIHTLSGQELLADRHLDFLINEYLKELDVSVFVASGCSLKAIEERIALVGNGFKKVSVGDMAPYDEIEGGLLEFINATICYLSNVEVLHIYHHCNDTTLKNISSFCTKLSELNIDGSYNVTIKGLEMLCKNQGEHQSESLIKILSMRYINVSDSGISSLLNNMPQLEVLNYNDLPTVLYSMHKEDLKNNTLHNVKKYNLTELNFWSVDTVRMSTQSHDIVEDNRISQRDILNVWTEVCPNIKTLYLETSSENYLDLISRFSKLENLTVGIAFDNANEKGIEFNNFLKTNGAKLLSLQIDGFSLSVPTLIESCPKLQNLVLTNVQFHSLEQNLIQGQPYNNRKLNCLVKLSLVEITFFDRYAEESIANILLSSPNIEKLSFEHCKFENSEMNTKLAKFCEDSTLQDLRFLNCNIDVALLESIILTCSSLVCLTIDYCDNIKSDEAFNLQQLRDTARSSLKIVYNHYESNENSIFSNEDDFYDDIYSDYEHDSDPDDYDLDDDSYLCNADDWY